MPQQAARAATPAEKLKSDNAARRAIPPFFGMIDAVIVDSPAEFDFDGAVGRDQAYGAWLWMGRDLASDLIDIEAPFDPERSRPALESLMPELLVRARDTLRTTETSPDNLRRIKTQLGGEANWAKLPVVLNALRCRTLLEKAQGFGRAANNVADETGLTTALQSMPIQDQKVAALLMMAMAGQVANPSRLITSAIRISGGAEEVMLIRAGFGPMVDALLAHAQNQVSPLTQVGTFGDMDLICRSVERFHRLVRAVNGYVELARGSRWSGIIAALTKTVSEKIEPKLQDVAPSLNIAMRRREVGDRLDADQILAALNGVYLLATVRDCRDSLALNTVFDQAWAQVGQALEIHLERYLELLRRDPGDKVASGRLDAAIKMAELRFNVEYAEVLRRAKDSVERRQGS